jgi:lactoylglutathione lyase
MGDENSCYADFRAGTAQLEIFSRREMTEAIGTADQPSFAESQDRVAVIFAVESVDEKFRQLRDKGVSFVTEPHDRNGWGIRVAHFRDPDGNLIEIN